MSEFEVLLIPLSLILGLGVTRVLSAFTHTIRLGGAGALHWLPLTWAFCVLFYTVGYFNVLFDLGQRVESWTWAWYGPVLAQTMFLFLSAGLVLAGESEQVSTNMLDDFRARGRLALIPLGLLLGSAPLANLIQGSSQTWLSSGNLANYTLTIVIAIAFLTTKRQVQAAATVVFAVVSLIGWFFLWAQPGQA